MGNKASKNKAQTPKMAMASATAAPLQLPDIVACGPAGPFAIIVSYLQPKELSLLESCSKQMHTFTRKAWEELEGTIDESSRSVVGRSAKERTVRWELAEQFARKIEHQDHLHHESGHEPCLGCEAFPDIDPSVFARVHPYQSNRQQYRNYEFFLRLSLEHTLSDDSRTLVWQGFHHHPTLPHLRWALNAHLRGIQFDFSKDSIRHQWQCSEQLKELFLTDSEDCILRLAEVLFENLTLTLVAMARDEVYPQPTLVVTTFGFDAVTTFLFDTGVFVPDEAIGNGICGVSMNGRPMCSHTSREAGVVRGVDRRKRFRRVAPRFYWEAGLDRKEDAVSLFLECV